MTASKYMYTLFIAGLLVIGYFVIRITMSTPKTPTWLTSIKGLPAPKKQGAFAATDKMGRPVTFEWTLTDVRAPEFSVLMKSLSDVTVQAFTPVEVAFLKVHQDKESQSNYSKPFESLFGSGPMAENVQLFKKGLETADWRLVEAKMQTILQAIQLMDYSNFGVENVHCFVVVKDTASQKLLGYITFYVAPEFPHGDVKATGIGIFPSEQNRGLGRLLMSSIFKILPATKRIFLSTRPTNEKALKAYENWGFTPDINPIKEPWGEIDTKQWTYLEYKTGQSDVLQKTVETLVPIGK